MQRTTQTIPLLVLTFSLVLFAFSGSGVLAVPSTQPTPTSKKQPTPNKKIFADTILYHGHILTMNPKQPRAEAIAFRGDRILAVGSNAAIFPYQGPKTRVVRLQGKFVMPGFIEGHGHMLGLGKTKFRLDLVGTKNAQHIAEIVRSRRKKPHRGDWILGRGWDQNDWPTQRFPTHHMLSQAAPQNPVYLTRIDGHAAWVNQTALKLAGITKETPDPPGGKFIRDDQGNPTGVLIDSAMRLVRKHIPKTTAAQNKRALLTAIQTCLKNGVTSFHDAGVGPSGLQLYHETLKAKQLQVRMYVMLSGGNKAFREHALKRGPQIGLGNHFLTIRTFKLMVDGALGSRGAALLEPYADKPNHRGLTMWKPDALRAVVDAALKQGFQIATHAIGDRANRDVLDAYEVGFQANPQAKDPRFRIEHAQILHPTDILRFAKLNVIASVQPTHCTSDMPWVHARLGKQRAQQSAYVWQSLLLKGAKIVNGSDTPVESVNPLWGIYAAITRQDHNQQPPEGWYPAQRMSRMQALRGFTIDAAYGAFEEKIKGSLAPGKLADVIVLDKNILTIPAPELLQTHVEMTWVGGTLRYQRNSSTTRPKNKLPPFQNPYLH